MAGVPEYTPVLLGLGIRELSMSVTSVAKVKNIIRNISIEECEELVNNMLDKCDNNFSRSILRTFLRNKFNIDDTAFLTKAKGIKAIQAITRMKENLDDAATSV